MLQLHKIYAKILNLKKEVGITIRKEVSYANQTSYVGLLSYVTIIHLPVTGT